MRTHRHLSCGALALLAACTRYVPPAPPAPRVGTAVAASFGRTWDAVIDVFAERNIPIRTIERSSGFIATERLTSPYEPRSARDRRDVKADCGRRGALVYWPTHAVYNIVVRGDSGGATVRATVKWVSATVEAEHDGALDCSTTGVWEGNVEADIRARAEEAVAQAPLPGSTSSAASEGVVSPPTPPPASSAEVSGRASGSRARAGVGAEATPPATGDVPISVTIRVRVPDWVKDPAPVADFPLLLVGPRGDTSSVRTDDRGATTIAIPAGRYRVISPRPAVVAGGRQYGWDLTVDVHFPMPPVELDDRNAQRRAP